MKPDTTQDGPCTARRQDTMNRIQSVEYWAIYEELYDIKVKSAVPVEASKVKPSDDGCMEAAVCLNPAFTLYVNNELKTRNALTNSQNSSSA
ncbi:hypothetical protein CHS0354_039006 [Potamilus streckersoni]|uniref:Uncharacterized protein n=1 Tax=Potamilus streckersoni TaxID=2493646 RepID=A0AAE0TIE9_9BIVA|nr:hypothetical protein CHS0354_039006 [Potamilus streckersoni]